MDSASSRSVESAVLAQASRPRPADLPWIQKEDAMRPRPDVGKILGQTFSIFFGNFPAFMAICAIVLLPALVLQAWQQMDAFNNPMEPNLGLMIVGVLVSFVLQPIATGALTFGVFSAIRERKASITDCLSVGLRRALPVLGVSLVVGILTGLGYMLCLVPGIILMTMWVAAVPAAVVEEIGVGDALRRSSDLTRGHRWIVFGVVLVIALFGLLLGGGMAFVIAATLGESVLMIIVLNTVVTLFSSGLQATFPTLIYYHVRASKETIDLDEIAAVFD